MAKMQVSGKTPEQVEEMRKEFEDSPASEWYEFEERYCLCPTPRQPEDYDGPQRYCGNTAEGEKYGRYRCRHHHYGADNSENLTAGNPKHYMNASDEYLLKNLDEDEVQLYTDIMEWAEIYGIDKENDPAAYDDLKLLAKQRVREVKASKYIFDEGEIVDSLIRDEEGNLVLDEDGNPKTEEDTNVISKEYRRLINLIQSLKKDLIISRRERMKAEDRNAVSESAEQTSEALKELVSEEEKDFDVNEYEDE